MHTEYEIEKKTCLHTANKPTQAKHTETHILLHTWSPFTYHWCAKQRYRRGNRHQQQRAHTHTQPTSTSWHPPPICCCVRMPSLEWETLSSNGEQRQEAAAFSERRVALAYAVTRCPGTTQFSPQGRVCVNNTSFTIHVFLLLLMWSR